MFEDGFSHLPGGVFGSIEIKIDSLSAESNSWEDKVNFTADSNEDAYKRHTAVVMSSITVFVLFEAVSISRLFSAGGQNVTMPICSLVSPPNGMGVYFGILASSWTMERPYTRGSIFLSSTQCAVIVKNITLCIPLF